MDITLHVTSRDCRLLFLLFSKITKLKIHKYIFNKLWFLILIVTFTKQMKTVLSPTCDKIWKPEVAEFFWYLDIGYRAVRLLSLFDWNRRRLLVVFSDAISQLFSHARMNYRWIKRRESSVRNRTRQTIVRKLITLTRRNEARSGGGSRRVSRMEDIFTYVNITFS